MDFPFLFLLFLLLILLAIMTLSLATRAEVAGGNGCSVACALPSSLPRGFLFAAVIRKVEEVDDAYEKEVAPSSPAIAGATDIPQTLTPPLFFCLASAPPSHHQELPQAKTFEDDVKSFPPMHLPPSSVVS